MRKRYIQGIMITAVLLFALGIDLMIVKMPWETLPEMSILFEWAYGITLSLLMTLAPVMGAWAMREWEQGEMEKKRFEFFEGMVLFELFAAFSLNMAVGVYLQTNWVTALIHTVPILVSLFVFLVVYSVYDPAGLRLDILEYQYDEICSKIEEKEQEIEKIGNPCENEKGAIAKEIDHYMEVIDCLDANAREKKIAVRTSLMKLWNDEESIRKLTRSCTEIMEGRCFTIDADEEYQEFARRYHS